MFVLSGHVTHEQEESMFQSKSMFYLLGYMKRINIDLYGLLGKHICCFAESVYLDYQTDAYILFRRFSRINQSPSDFV